MGSGCQFKRNPTQTDASYREQLFAIKVCVESINSYLDLVDTGFVKNIIIARFPGSGKTFFVMYIVIYAHSKGLTVITVDMMCHQAIQLGGWYWRKLLCTPVDRGNNIYVCQMR